MYSAENLLTKTENDNALGDVVFKTQINKERKEINQ